MYPDTKLPQSKCNIRHCKWYRGTRRLDLSDPSSEVHYCSIFRDGIPEEICYGDNDHTKPIEGQVDQNILFMKGTNPSIVEPYRQIDMERPKLHGRDNLCSTIRDIYVNSSDEDIRLWCRLAMRMAKNQYVATQKYVGLLEKLGARILTSREDWQLRGEVGEVILPMDK